ncbi:O-antigen ligase family protein [Devosia sp.]|uniref:O-antigen ligase family protein n=1 Tax=Devosia sp. TaxID=1871048 RepID=UPI003A924B6A
MSAPAPSTYIRWVGYAILLSLFVLPALVGRNTSVTLAIGALLLLFSPSSLKTLRQASPNPVDWIFLGSFVALGLAFALSSEDLNDFKYIFNFAPYLLMVPLRKQFERLARMNAAETVAWMAFAGTVLFTAVALFEVFIEGRTRVYGPMNSFQFAYTTMLLGFLSLAGLFSDQSSRRWIFLTGPMLAVFTVMISGTRGALLAAPVLTILSFVFAMVTMPKHRKVILFSGVGAVALFAVLLFIAMQLGLTRSISGLDVPRQLLAGEKLDKSSFERLTMLQGAWGAFWDSPIWGHGWRDMVPAIFPHVPPETVARMSSFRHLHNGYANFGVGAGLIGVISFILVLAAPVLGTFFMPRDSQFHARLFLALTLALGFATFELTYILLGFDYHGFQFVFMTAVILGFVRDPVAQSTGFGTREVGSDTAQTA